MGEKDKIENPGPPYLTKREFLKVCCMTFSAMYAADIFWFPFTLPAQTHKKGLVKRKPSPYFTTIEHNIIRCDLCPRYCQLHDGDRGYCRVRENRNGRCYSLVYGNPCVVYFDKIEREGFFHVLPGSKSLTLSTVGCNLHCKFCENWEISQAFPEDVYSQEFDPATLIEKTRQAQARSITFTYAEPTIFYEYMTDIANNGKKEGLLNLFHSNGYINPDPLHKLCSLIDAAHIDLKGFTDESYQQLSDGDRGPVLETLKIIKQEKIHLEISILVIPTVNDDMSMIRDLCLWIKRELGIDIPVHFSRFYPLYKLQRLPPTPVSTLEQARETALSAGLRYVYIGNVPGHEAWNTYCHRCGKMLIQRIGYMIGEMHLHEGKCEYCGQDIPGIWS